MLRKVVVLSLAAAASAAGGTNYDRCDHHVGHGGPNYWATTDGAFCGAEQQSPIDLCGATVASTRIDYHTTTIPDPNPDGLNNNGARFTPVAVTGSTTQRMTLSTDGQAYLSPAAAKDTTAASAGWTATVGNVPQDVGRVPVATTTEQTWKFAQAHFHWGRHGHKDEGSEHYKEGVQYPLEVHFVHVNSKYLTAEYLTEGKLDLTKVLATGKSDALMVVGQFFKVDDADTVTVNAEMTKLVTALKGSTKSTEVTMAPYGLVDTTEGFYAYPGSLTTPTCNAVVTWVVMHKVTSIKSSTLALFHDNTADSAGHKAEFGNFRNLQKKGDRTVRYYLGSDIPFEFKPTACISTGAREPVFECPANKMSAEAHKIEDLSTSLQQSMDKADVLTKEGAAKDITIAEHVAKELKITMAGAGSLRAAVLAPLMAALVALAATVY